jgi:hypothetical protein
LARSHVRITRFVSVVSRRFRTVAGPEADDALGLLAGLPQIAELAQASGRIAGERSRRAWSVVARSAGCLILSFH